VTGDQLRLLFLQFFQQKGHLVVPSSSLIPTGDPSLLFTTAGMVQMKPYFLGEVSRPAGRLASIQKCFRTTDIDQVGDHKHLTFFEMLGNFSVGDYFKPEAVRFAWEFLTQWLELDPDRLWITVYLDDTDAYELWSETVGIPPDRIYRYGRDDNWWGPPGVEGPCGPCSEIHYDFGAARGCGLIADPESIAQWQQARANGDNGAPPGCHPNCDKCDRFIELWNLVFMQFFEDRATELSRLPSPNIDTGMGLERVAVITQGVSDVYATDLFQPIVSKVEELIGKGLGGGSVETDRAIRVVAEHTRGAVFLIADGVVPGNDGRGYVLRRLVRRAVRFGRDAGILDQFIGNVAEIVIDQMGPAYPELPPSRGFILRVLSLEEEKFAEVFEAGRTILGDQLIPLQQGLLARSMDPKHSANLLDINFLEGEFVLMSSGDSNLPPDMISGANIFVLWDTYGFPPELTEEIARERGLRVDIEGFQKEMEDQRGRSRAGAREIHGGLQAKIFRYEAFGESATRFVGYENLYHETEVVGLITDGALVEGASAESEIELVLRETPFYPEGGGQSGDVGEIISALGEMQVTETISPVAGLIVHKGFIRDGKFTVGDRVYASVDQEKRLDAARNHTSTHLLHAALQKVLGKHVRQAGSMVSPERLRFDFTHIQALSRLELEDIERLVNEQIRLNEPVSNSETSFAEAVRDGALAFFGDKYGAAVRVVKMGRNTTESITDEPWFSKEVCGGTHLDRTGEVGFFLVQSESSIGSGLRRIEAVTGRHCEYSVRDQLNMLRTLEEMLGTPSLHLRDRLSSLVDELEQEKKNVVSLERQLSLREANALLATAKTFEGVTILAAEIFAPSADSVRDVGDFLRDKLKSGIIILGSIVNDRPIVLTMVTPDLVEQGFNAEELVKEAAKVIGGGGGGKPEMAQAGGKRKEKLQEAIALVSSLVRR